MAHADQSIPPERTSFPGFHEIEEIPDRRSSSLQKNSLLPDAVSADSRNVEQKKRQLSLTDVAEAAPGRYPAAASDRLPDRESLPSCYTGYGMWLRRLQNNANDP